MQVACSLDCGHPGPAKESGPSGEKAPTHPGGLLRTGEQARVVTENCVVPAIAGDQSLSAITWKECPSARLTPRASVGARPEVCTEVRRVGGA